MHGLLARARSLWRTLLRRAAFEAEMDEEFRLHLELRTEDLVRSGMTRGEAARRARLEFGGVERYKEEARGALGTRWLDELAADVKYAVRTFRRRPVFALAGVLTLALGIGVATTGFSLFDAAYLRALAYPDADRLVALWQDHGGQGGPAEERFNPPDFASVRERSRALERVAGMMGWSPVLTGTGRPERLNGRSVSHEYFGLFGARPIAGRFFLSDDETPAGVRSAVIGHGLWLRRFGGDPALVGRVVELDGEAYTVVGIAPADFRPPGGAVEVWRPMRGGPGGSARMFRVIDVVGRLAAGASLDAARTELDALAAEIAGAYPRSNAGVAFRLAPLGERILGPVRPALFALLGAVVLVLVIACANVAGLLLARGVVRGREVAVRAALGAPRGRLVRQLVAEGLLLGVLGGAAGVLLAVGGIRLLSSILPADALPGAEVGSSPGIAAGALGLSLATTLAFALVPAVRLSGIDPARTLKEGGGPGSAGGASRARSVLVVTEIALSFVLLVGAGLFLRSFTALLAVDPGFRGERVLTAELSLSGDRYPDGAAVSRFYDAVLGELRRRPGVLSAGATSFLPLRGGDNDVSFRIEGAAARAAEDAPLAWYRVATPGYFQAMRIPLLRGRAFTERDRRGAPGVVVVNETLARRYWPDADPVGERLSPEWADGRWLTVVGVVGDVRHDGLTEGAAPELYFPHAQMAGAAATMAIVVETAEDPARFAPYLREVVRSLDPDLPLERVSTMDGLLARSLALPRLHLWTFGTFAVLALLLAAVGLYGVVSTVVAQRTRDIGVRMAVGARPADVMRWVLRRAAALVVLGIGIGLLGALAFARTLAGLLHGPGPTDPMTLVSVVLVLGGAALVASLVPARRAAAVDAMTALRAE